MRPGRTSHSLTLAILAFTAFSSGGALGQTSVAVVVRPDVPASNLSFSDLRKLLLGDRQFWSSNQRVTLLMPPPGSWEWTVLLKTVYQMSEWQYRQHWISKQVRAEASSAPRFVYSNENAIEQVSAIPGAVAFMDASHVPRTLKVLRIDGLLPGERRYPLH